MNQLPIMQSFQDATAKAEAQGWPRPAAHHVTQYDVKALAQELKTHGQLPPSVMRASADDDCALIQRLIRGGQLVFDGVPVKVAEVAWA